MTGRLAAAFLIAVCLASGCAGAVVILDRPEYHYQTGLRLLNQGNLAGARQEFEYAVYLDGTYLPGLVGLAITQGTLGELDKAVETLRRVQQLHRGASSPSP